MPFRLETGRDKLRCTRHYCGLCGKAFSSEVGTGSRKENASEQSVFSSEADSGSRHENAVENQNFRARLDDYERR